jgi:hypothetical protein
MKGENPMQNLEEAIRERAYHLWIADGQPEGHADIFWLNAQREILTTSVESRGSVAAAGASTDMETVATKPAKKQGPPDREKARPAPHSYTRASSRWTRDDDAISERGSPAPRYMCREWQGRRLRHVGHSWPLRCRSWFVVQISVTLGNWAPVASP